MQWYWRYPLDMVKKEQQPEKDQDATAEDATIALTETAPRKVERALIPGGFAAPIISLIPGLAAHGKAAPAPASDAGTNAR